ncbi:MAG TPA: MFS transporter [Aestuariivirgaceae bacterium]|nr:MFS transporter [Aestuariivirgaceae bacterium]
MMKRKQLATRLAIASMFLIHGVITGAWVPHIPLAQQRLGADLAAFGLALLALAAGAVTAMPIAGSLIHKHGSARVTLATGILFCLSFAMPALAGTIGWFVAGLAIFGAAMGAMDVAMNAQALAYEKQIGKPVMSLFHGMYSAGAMGGAGLSALVLGQFSAHTHLAGAVVIGLATICVAAFFLLPADTDRGLAEKRFFAWPSRATIGLGSLCFLAYMSEGAVLDWSAIELRQKFSLSAHVAGIGYGAFAGGMALARFTGDALRSRFGPVALVRSSAALAAAGMIIALAGQDAVMCIAAYGLAGLGLGNIVPVLLSGGGRLEPEAPGRAIAAVVAMGFAGSVIGPPFIGLAAQGAGLSAALGFIVIAMGIIVAVANTAKAARV